MTFSEKLFSLRKESGFSQEDLAEKLNVSRQAVSRWEMGTAVPDCNNLLQISKLFKVTTDYLLNDDYESDRDIPIVKKTQSKMKEEQNRQLAFIALVSMQALSFFWAIMGHIVWNSILIILTMLTANIISTAVFEIVFRRSAIPKEIASEYRRKYYRVSIWLFSYFPVRMIVVAFLKLFMTEISMLLISLASLAAYLIFCVAVSFLLRKRKEK